MYFSIYVPRLQTEQGMVWFFRDHRVQPLPSAAPMSPMSQSFVAKLEGFVAEQGLPLVSFRKGRRKETVMAEHLRKFGEKTSCRQGPGEDAGVPHREAAEPDHRASLSMDRALDRSPQAANAPQVCALPIRTSISSCMRSSCSATSLQNRSPEAQSLINCAACVSTVSLRKANECGLPALRA
jgi:hypothetical protein